MDPRENENLRRRDCDTEGVRRPLEVGVFCETGKLKTLGIWGLPGNETYLAQFLPSEISLFTSNFDVLEARKEYSRIRSFLEQNGIGLIEMRKVVADRLLREKKDKDFPQTEEQMVDALAQRAMKFNRKFQLQPALNQQLIKELLEADILELGLRRALVLNGTLCLSKDLPMANIVFARDQTSIIGSHLFFSKMMWEIRQPEVELYRLAYESLGLKNSHCLKTKDSSLEGGDVIVFRRTCYIGVGIRTTQEAALEVFETLYKEKNNEIDNFVIVASPQQEEMREEARRAGKRPEIECIHLDTFWMPASDNLIVACIEEVKRRVVRLVNFDREGKANVIQEIPFVDYLNRLGVEIIDLPYREQVNHGTNFLNLGDKKAIISLSSNSFVLEEMKRKGIRTLSADIFELAKAGGGVHCLTLALLREVI